MRTIIIIKFMVIDKNSYNNNSHKYNNSYYKLALFSN